MVRVERIELSSRAPKTRSLPLTDTHIDGAFSQGRTDDLILTMDALCLLSYESIRSISELNGYLRITKPLFFH